MTLTAGLARIPTPPREGAGKPVTLRLTPWPDSVDAYIKGLDILSRSALPAAELKAAYRNLQGEFRQAVKLISLDETHRYIAAERRALIAIARATTDEAGLPARSYEAIGRDIDAAFKAGAARSVAHGGSARVWIG